MGQNNYDNSSGSTLPPPPPQSPPSITVQWDAQAKAYQDVCAAANILAQQGQYVGNLPIVTPSQPR